MTNGSPRRTLAGFTLLEVMITVVIVGILASIALPSYNYFITRSRITEATNTLSNMRTQMEKWFMDHRNYDDGTGKCGIEAAVPNLIATYNADTNNKFTISCALGAPPTSYVLTATGGGVMSGFSYTVNEQNAKLFESGHPKSFRLAGTRDGWRRGAGGPRQLWVVRKPSSHPGCQGPTALKPSA